MLTIDFNRLGVEPGMRVLDAGCGQGRHSIEVMRRGAQAVALDLIHHDLKYTAYLLASVAREGIVPPMVHYEDSPFARALEDLERDKASSAQPVAPTRAPASLVLCANTLRLPFPDATFDRVLCSEVLEHVVDPAQATRELVRVLKPGGLFAASVPTPFSEHAFHFGSDEYFNSPGGHVRIFTVPRLMTMLEAEGLRPADLHFEHSFHTVYWW